MYMNNKHHFFVRRETNSTSFFGFIFWKIYIAPSKTRVQILLKRNIGKLKNAQNKLKNAQNKQVIAAADFLGLEWSELLHRKWLETILVILTCGKLMGFFGSLKI